jgi:lipopolysaccharide/colanic/teichoic acid biosynthesis glycosyltransferase
MHNFQLAIKRILDVSACFAILVLGLPFFLLMGFLVKISSPGPLFFVQPRVGKDEKIFRMIKFRTMKGNPDPHATRWTMKDEERITSIGRFLRDYGLDELPQVVNIIKGDMSIVGPRPPLPTQISTYSSVQRKVFLMRPGVLSLAAIDGRRAISVDERIALHVQYVKNWSLGLDIRIILRCLFVVMGKENAAETIVHDK